LLKKTIPGFFNYEKQKASFLFFFIFRQRKTSPKNGDSSLNRTQAF